VRESAAEREPTEEEQSFEGRWPDIPGIPPEGTLVLGTRKHGNHAVPAVLSFPSPANAAILDRAVANPASTPEGYRLLLSGPSSQPRLAVAAVSIKRKFPKVYGASQLAIPR